MLWTGAYCEASVWVNPGRTLVPVGWCLSLVTQLLC